MNKFRVMSHQSQETNKWTPAGMVIEGTRLKEVDSIGPDKFDTKDEADGFFRKFRIEKGYEELIQS